MKYGTYFAYWEREWEADFISYCEKVSRLGFDVLEVSGGGLAEMSAPQLKELEKAASTYGITLTACIGLPRQYDVSSSEETTRQNGLAYVKKLMDHMQIAGIRLLGGITYAYWPADYSLPVDKAAARANSIKSVRELADYGAQYGITLALETVNRFEHFLINDAAEAVQFTKDIGKDNVKILLDCFHMNIEEDNLGDAIRNTGNLLGHFHIGECNRKVPGKGHMPWSEIGQALKDIHYEGYVVMEPFVKPGGTVGSDIKVWRDLSENASDEEMDGNIKDALTFVKNAFK